MAYHKIPEAPVEALQLSTMQVMFDTYKTLWDFGYRGSFSTTTSVIEVVDSEPIITESGRFDMVLQNAVPVSVALGGVILYRTSPAVAVVACLSADEFAAEYEAV